MQGAGGEDTKLLPGPILLLTTMWSYNYTVPELACIQGLLPYLLAVLQTQPLNTMESQDQDQDDKD